MKSVRRRYLGPFLLFCAVVLLIGLAYGLFLHSFSSNRDQFGGDNFQKPLASTPNTLIGMPYLQLGNVPLDDPDVRIDVAWLASPDLSRWSVEYKEESESSWKNAGEPHFRLVDIEGVPAHRVYNVKIGGLAAGQNFDYRLLRNGLPIFAGQAPAKNSDKQNYRFVLFGDCGANTPSQKKVAYQAYLAKPNFIFIPGDIVYGGGRISQYRKNFFSVYESLDATPEKGAPLLESTTMIAAPGNHDTDQDRNEGAPDVLAYFLYWIQPLNGPSLKVGGPNSPDPPDAKYDPAFETGAGPTFPTMENFSFDWGNSHWTVLDSNPYVDWNDPNLRRWVEADLRQADNKRWRFVAFHHPGFNSSKSHFNDQWMRTLAGILQAGKVDMVFSGHVHNYQRSLPLKFEIADAEKPGKTPWKQLVGHPVEGTFSLDKDFDGVTKTYPKGIIYIVTGAGGQSLYNPEQQKHPKTWQKFTATFVSEVHSFTVVDIEGDQLQLKQVSENGDVLDQIRITK